VAAAHRVHATAMPRRVRGPALPRVRAGEVCDGGQRLSDAGLRTLTKGQIPESLIASAIPASGYATTWRASTDRQPALPGK
jgi:hypothetical protein